VLREIEIQNFRCLKQVNVALRPLTVLIGPNDSGKSAFLAAIEHLIAGAEKFDSEDYWRGEQTSGIVLIGHGDDGHVECRPERKRGKTRVITPHDLALASISPVSRFQLPTAGVVMKCAGYSAEEEAKMPVGQSGERTAALLDYFLRRDRKRFFDVVDVLKKNIPGLDDIAIGTPDAQTRQIELVIDGGFQLAADRASAGVRLLLFFVALSHHPRPPRTILLEEPENGIHSKRLSSVMQLLRSLTKPGQGRPAAQIVITTHSPYLLDAINLSEDQVLVFRRNDDGSRSAEPVDVDRMKNFLDEFMLGEVWFNEEEAGLVAKK